MKLIIAIVNDEDGTKVMDDLNANGFSVTKLFSSGGFLKSGNTTLLMGVEEQKIDDVLTIIKRQCKSRKTDVKKSRNVASQITGGAKSEEIIVSGATVFISDVERFEKV